ncbi:hypothetical protein DL96DRAFT_1752954 [Flagelloscypha sp. PMI_526]|nr:hypothetical protein DL96DRAFT_1752954 [Flagelloscypha sp. PMI_526]
MQVLVLVLSLLVSTQVYAWSFVAVEGGSCGPLVLTWAGGKGPFTARIHPIGGTTIKYDIPNSAISSGQGSYEIQLPLAKDQKFLVTMGDADGVVSGGTSAVLTASAQPATSTSCSTTLATPNFFWSAGSDSIAQCQPYPFTQIGTTPNAKVVRPTYLLVLIPNGNQSYSIEMPKAESFAWTVDVKAGTRFVPDMFDSQGNQGGVGNLLNVQTGTNSCTLHSNVAQASTPGSPSKSGSKSAPKATSTDPSAETPSNDDNSGGVSAAAIAGIVIGVLVVIAAVALALFFYRRRRRSGGTRGVNSDDKYVMDENLPPVKLDPFHLPPPATADGASSRYSMGTTSAAPSIVQSTYSAYPTKSQLAYRLDNDSVPNYIQHRDINDDELQLPPPDEPIELPPSYSQARAPLRLHALGVENGGPPLSGKQQQEQAPAPAASPFTVANNPPPTPTRSIRTLPSLPPPS